MIGSNSIRARIVILKQQSVNEAKLGRVTSADHIMRSVRVLERKYKEAQELEEGKKETKPQKVKSKKPSSKRNTKYTYPPGMSSDEKRRFRAQQRKLAKDVG